MPKSSQREGSGERVTPLWMRQPYRHSVRRVSHQGARKAAREHERERGDEPAEVLRAHRALLGQEGNRRGAGHGGE